MDVLAVICFSAIFNFIVQLVSVLSNTSARRGEVGSLEFNHKFVKRSLWFVEN